MNGSEKQVRWAEDIKKRLLEDGAKRLEDFENLIIAYRTEDTTSAFTRITPKSRPQNKYFKFFIITIKVSLGLEVLARS
jgi:hypothetical protein